ncbi:MAG: ribosome silencing factor [Planctomycetaceae bacterium]|nr:ribosome silencing factor [Planctomycetaceae bacterium]
MPNKTPETAPLQLAILCAELADKVKAEDVRVLDVRGISGVTDYFVLATGNNEPHVRAIWNEIARRTKELHLTTTRNPEGARSGKWVVLDFYDVVVHVLHRDQRTEYDLDALWNDAPAVPLPFIEKATA